MSSIMRRRRGLISAIWGTSCLRIGLRQPQSCQTGGLPSQPPTFYNYCDSGLVQSVLYINDTRRGHIRAFDLMPNGTLAKQTDRVFVDLRGAESGVPDGMKVDV